MTLADAATSPDTAVDPALDTPRRVFGYEELRAGSGTSSTPWSPARTRPCRCPAANGVWTTRRAHQRTFTNDYHDYVGEQVASGHAVGGKQGVRDVPARTKAELAGISQASLDEGWAWD